MLRTTRPPTQTMPKRQTASFLIKKFREAGIQPDPRRGQNFLVDLNLLDILIDAGLVRRVVQLPYASLGELFKGRESQIEDLAEALGPALQRDDQPAVSMALTGLGGTGKTRLALEYAWRHAGDYPAMLLVGADSSQCDQLLRPA